jgi:hypothetical protein
MAEYDNKCGLTTRSLREILSRIFYDTFDAYYNVVVQLAQLVSLVLGDYALNLNHLHIDIKSLL